MSNNLEPMDYETDPSEYEEDDEASSEEESDPEPEPAQNAAETTPSSPPVAVSLNHLFQSVSQPDPISSSEEESESESDVPIAGSGARKPRPDVATPTKLANGKREAEEEESCYEDSKKAKIPMEILPKTINFSPTEKPVGGSAEEMMMTLGDQLFVDGEKGEEWRRLKYEEVESYTRILEVKSKQSKFITNFLKSC